MPQLRFAPFVLRIATIACQHGEHRAIDEHGVASHSVPSFRGKAGFEPVPRCRFFARALGSSLNGEAGDALQQLPVVMRVSSYFLRVCVCVCVCVCVRVCIILFGCVCCIFPWIVFPLQKSVMRASQLQAHSPKPRLLFSDPSRKSLLALPP